MEDQGSSLHEVLTAYKLQKLFTRGEDDLGLGEYIQSPRDIHPEDLDSLSEGLNMLERKRLRTMISRYHPELEEVDSDASECAVPRRSLAESPTFKAACDDADEDTLVNCLESIKGSMTTIDGLLHPDESGEAAEVAQGALSILRASKGRHLDTANVLKKAIYNSTPEAAYPSSLNWVHHSTTIGRKRKRGQHISFDLEVRSRESLPSKKGTKSMVSAEETVYATLEEPQFLPPSYDEKKTHSEVEQPVILPIEMWKGLQVWSADSP